MYTFELKEPHFLPQISCDIRFNVTRGQILVIVGENGIGKTTLLQRFIQQCTVHSIAVAEQKSLDYFYDYSLKQISEIEPGIETYWEYFGLSQKKDRRLSVLSGGESQSLKLSSALASSKELYVLDEPSQALDQEKKQKLSDLIFKMASQGKTFLVVEHDLEWLPKNVNVIKLVPVDGVIKVVDQWTT